MQAVVLCQVEKAKEDMLNKLYSSVRLATILKCECADHMLATLIFDLTGGLLNSWVLFFKYFLYKAIQVYA